MFINSKIVKRSCPLHDSYTSTSSICVYIPGYKGVIHRHAPQNKRIITTSKLHLNNATKQAINACKPTSVITVGGAGYKVSWIETAGFTHPKYIT